MDDDQQHYGLGMTLEEAWFDGSVDQEEERVCLTRVKLDAPQTMLI